MKRGIFAIWAATLLCAETAQAGTYNFTYTFDGGAVITGSLWGIATGNMITNLSNVVVKVDGYKFHRSGMLHIYSWSPKKLKWVSAPAHISFDGTENNFSFTDAKRPESTHWNNQFFGITGKPTSPIAPPEVAYGDYKHPINGSDGSGDFPPNASWRVTPAIYTPPPSR
jgi:hypothetical protein